MQHISPKSNFLSVLMILALLFLLTLQNEPSKNVPPPIATNTKTSTNGQIVYTEDVEEFKKVKYNQRLELLVGCWLMTKEYSEKGHFLYNDFVKLNLIKKCLKKITRKDSVLKITELIGKNMEKSKIYQEVVPQEDIQEVLPSMIQVSEKELNEVSEKELNEVSEKESIGVPETKSIKNVEEKESIKNVEEKSKVVETKFDLYLLELISKYEKQLSELDKKQFEGETLSKRVQQQLQKRFIPANQLTHVLMLAGIALILVLLCSCYKYYYKRKEASAVKRLMKGNKDKHGDNCKHEDGNRAYQDMINKTVRKNMKKE